jgi:hypothetical protein
VEETVAVDPSASRGATLAFVGSEVVASFAMMVQAAVGTVTQQEAGSKSHRKGS